jgi:thymidine phosphorylase
VIEALEGAYRIGSPGDTIENGGPLLAGRVD